MLREKVQFQIDIEGESKRYQGLFEMKLKLSWRELAREDEVRRAILGVNSSEASPEMDGVARAAAYLSVRLTDTPTWWKEGGNGLELNDLNVLPAVHEAAVKAANDEHARVKAEADKAKGSLSKEADGATKA